MEIKNATIESVSLSNADHGLLSAWLTLNYGGSGQGFGGFNLYTPKQWEDKDAGNYTGHFIWRVLEITGVTDWNKLPGKIIRVRVNETGVIAIGHALLNIWFNPSEEFKKYSQK